MKSYLVIPLLLFSFISFSQTDDKKILSLMDSIETIQPYERLYVQNTELSAENQRYFLKSMHLRQNEAELKEFFFRQILYRKIFDQLELGIIPDQLELENYNMPGDQEQWIDVYWKLFEIPKSDSKSPIIVFIDPDIDILLKESSAFKNYPFNDIGLAFKNGDAVLKKRYPKVYAMIKNRRIIFKDSNFETPLITAMQAPKLEFPSQLFAKTNRSPESRQKLAIDLLSWISNDARNYDVTGNLVPVYLKKVEKERLNNATVEQQINYRTKFIEYIIETYKPQ